MSQQSTLSYVPSLVLATPDGTGMSANVPLVVPAAVPGPDVPITVPEPLSVAVIAPVLLAFLLLRNTGLCRRRARSEARTDLREPAEQSSS